MTIIVIRYIARPAKSVDQCFSYELIFTVIYFMLENVINNQHAKTRYCLLKYHQCLRTVDDYQRS